MDVTGQPSDTSIFDVIDINIPGMASPIPFDTSMPRYENVCTSPQLTADDRDSQGLAHVTQSATHITRSPSCLKKVRDCDHDSGPEHRGVNTAECPHEARGQSAPGASPHVGGDSWTPRRSNCDQALEPPDLKDLRFLPNLGNTSDACPRDALQPGEFGTPTSLQRRPSDCSDDALERVVVVSGYAARTSTPNYPYSSDESFLTESRQEESDTFEGADDDFDDRDATDDVANSSDDDRTNDTIDEDEVENRPTFTPSNLPVGSRVFTPPRGVESTGETVSSPALSASRSAQKPSWARLTTWGFYTRTVLIAIDASSEAKYAFHWYLEHVWKKNDLLVLAHVPQTPSFPMFSFKKFVSLPVEEWSKVIENMNRMTTKVHEEYEIECLNRNLKYKLIAESFEKAGEGICQLASEENVDLIVIGEELVTGTLKRILLNRPSVSEYVVRNAGIPCIVVQKQIDDEPSMQGASGVTD